MSLLLDYCWCAERDKFAIWAYCQGVQVHVYRYMCTGTCVQVQPQCTPTDRPYYVGKLETRLNLYFCRNHFEDWIGMRVQCVSVGIYRGVGVRVCVCACACACV